MIIYKCDRCGEKLYRARMITVTIEDCNAPEVVETEYHYCPECFEDLRASLEDDIDDLR